MSKGLYALDDFVFEKGTLLEQSNNLEIVKKELKAFKIIEECLIVKDNGDYIEIACEFSIPKKIKEKYDLLKEVLL